LKATSLVLTLICAGSLFSSAQDGSNDLSTRSRIVVLEQAWNQAEQRKDTRALDAIFDSSLVYVDYDGKLLTKAEFLTSIKSENAHPSNL
jgi:hypothetical protein